MNSDSMNRISQLARAGLALAVLLLLLPAPVHAITLNATKDTYVSEARPTRNYGSSTRLKVKLGSNGAFDGPGAYWSFVEFDISVMEGVASC